VRQSEQAGDEKFFQCDRLLSGSAIVLPLRNHLVRPHQHAEPESWGLVSDLPKVINYLCYFALIPRHPRIHAAGVLCHIMARGNNGQRIFLKRGDREAFLEALGTVRRRYRFYLYAYVLMSNHFHLLLEVMDTPTARIMQSLLTL
jgi:hypothetical protein